MVSCTCIVLMLTVTVLSVYAAPILTQQNNIIRFPNSRQFSPNVFLPFRELPERLIDDFTSEELDDGRDLPSESDIFYFFRKATIFSDGLSSKKRNGF